MGPAAGRRSRCRSLARAEQDCYDTKEKGWNITLLSKRMGLFEKNVCYHLAEWAKLSSEADADVSKGHLEVLHWNGN